MSRYPVDERYWIVELINRTAEADISRAHTDFVANASHELRTPLASIIGYVETLSDMGEQVDAKTAARFHGTVLKEAKRLQTLVDDLMSLFMNVFLIIPSLPLLIVLVGFLGSGGALYFVLVLAVTGWSWGARVLRSQTLSIREKDFIAAAEVSGESRFRIIVGEIFPNMISLVAANMFGATIYAIGAMAALQFLGLGNPSVVSWGTNLYWAQNNGALLTGAWWTVVPSGVSIALVAFAFALTNYAVDEVTNPRLKAQRVSREALAKLGGAAGKQSRATPVIRHAN